MISIAHRRIMNELRKTHENICIQIREGNIELLEVSIHTEIRGVKPKLIIDLSNGYPFEPPKIIFLTHLTHPNIDPRGQICLDILRRQFWSPSFTILSIILSIIEFMNDETTWKYSNTMPEWEKHVLNKK